MRSNKYIEYAKLEMRNDKYVRFVAMSYCYGNVLVFQTRDIPKELSKGDVCELIYVYSAGAPLLCKCKKVDNIPVSKWCNERMVSNEQIA